MAVHMGHMGAHDDTAWAGITRSPAVGAVLMSVSTIVVAFNAQLLRRLDLRPGRTSNALPVARDVTVAA